MKFFKMSPTVSKYEFGVAIEDRPSDEQRARLMQILQASVAQGQVERPADLGRNADLLAVLRGDGDSSATSSA